MIIIQNAHIYIRNKIIFNNFMRYLLEHNVFRQRLNTVQLLMVTVQGLIFKHRSWRTIMHVCHSLSCCSQESRVPPNYMRCQPRTCEFSAGSAYSLAALGDSRTWNRKVVITDSTQLRQIRTKSVSTLRESYRYMTIKLNRVRIHNKTSIPLRIMVVTTRPVFVSF